MPAQYAAPDGLDLRLYGRSADGESVVVEKNIESLSIALILDVNFPDANAAMLRAVSSETSGMAPPTNSPPCIVPMTTRHCEFTPAWTHLR